MTAYAATDSPVVVKKSFLQSLSLRSKIIAAAVLVFLVMLVIAIPGDQSQLVARQDRVGVAQVAYDLALPAVEPMMTSVITFINATGADMTGNRLFTGLTSAVTSFNRANATGAARFQGVVTFSANVHSLLDGVNTVPELDSVELRTLAASMDTTLSVAYLALMELNDATDEYNGYHSWISARLAAALYSLPNGFPDPIPSNSRLTRDSLTQ